MTYDTVSDLFHFIFKRCVFQGYIIYISCFVGARGPMPGPRIRGGLLGDMPSGERRDGPGLTGPRGPVGFVGDPRGKLRLHLYFHTRLTLRHIVLLSLNLPLPFPCSGQPLSQMSFAICPSKPHFPPSFPSPSPLCFSVFLTFLLSLSLSPPRSLTLPHPLPFLCLFPSLFYPSPHFSNSNSCWRSRFLGDLQQNPFGT